MNKVFADFFFFFLYLKMLYSASYALQEMFEISSH